MRAWDIQVLFHFIRRPGMYTGSSKIDDFKKIDTFLIAYEMGSMGECRFREKLIKRIEDKYGVHMPSEGLVKQLRIASKKVKQEVKEFFVKESLEILIKESDHNNQNLFIRQGRKELIQQLEQFPEELNIFWVSIFANKIKELDAWKGANITDEERTKIEKFITEINRLVAVL